MNMKKLVTLVVSSILVASLFGCQESSQTGTETSSNNGTSASVKSASNTTQTTDKTTKTDKIGKEKSVDKNNKSKTEATDKTTGKTTTGDLKTEVTKKLKEGLPGNKLEVEDKGGEVILKGTVGSEADLKKAETLVKAVKGVKTVKVEAKVEPAKKP
ncbi:transport-associated protein [Richelia sinica FACHB-800]|uniref:Transport-associated protein n=2 Tax=Richelia TaxID=98443 RepID=A0A975T730_9NOST|nr:transport-associated protein [Richelia sinica FACHB-800]